MPNKVLLERLEGECARTGLAPGGQVRVVVPPQWAGGTGNVLSGADIVGTFNGVWDCDSDLDPLLVFTDQAQIEWYIPLSHIGHIQVLRQA